MNIHLHKNWEGLIIKQKNMKAIRTVNTSRESITSVINNKAWAPVHSSPDTDWGGLQLSFVSCFLPENHSSYNTHHWYLNYFYNKSLRTITGLLSVILQVKLVFPTTFRTGAAEGHCNSRHKHCCLLLSTGSCLSLPTERLHFGCCRKRQAQHNLLITNTLQVTLSIT